MIGWCRGVESVAVHQGLLSETHDGRLIAAAERPSEDRLPSASQIQVRL